MKPTPSARLKLAIRGAVQGVGFRPFVHRLAAEHCLAGWVRNSPQGVFIEAEGPRVELENFLHRLEVEHPPHSSIQSVESSWLDMAGYRGFEIRKSELSGSKTALVLPDLATCPDCLREIFDPADRRYLYPFTNCTHCGPRFSIIESLPYDRANTSMKEFAMCSQCCREYEDPANRRFHAQPNACPHCGPRLELWKGANSAARQLAIAHSHAALLGAAEAIRNGEIVAVKGIGGFHLMADACNDSVVHRLRLRKHREEKPFALLFPSLECARTVCEISPLEAQLLLSPQAPIVLLRKNQKAAYLIANSVAPGNLDLGIMLPSNPLHHLLMDELKSPVVATSGNLSEEPICTDEWEAYECLGEIADVFLVHNRPIVRHMDDSIVCVTLDREMILRRARGYAPLPVPLNSSKDDRNESTEKADAILAVGGHLKNSVALAVGRQVFISQHIGNLENEKANNAFRGVIADLQKLYEAKPDTIVADLHPDYLSSKFASKFSAAPLRVQHHVAHVLSCMADNEIAPPALGVGWDGTGCGPDGTIWGGEFFIVKDEMVERVAHLRPFPLPGADAAVREPRRSAIGLLYEIFGEGAFDFDHLPLFQHLSLAERRAARGILQRQIRSPLTTSVGRLFDGVASLTGLRHTSHFEGQAAMELEFAIRETDTPGAYPLTIQSLPSPIRLDWEPMIKAILADMENKVPIGLISAKFHNTMARAIVEVAKRLGEQRVVLSGGCFQNRYLLKRTVKWLREEKFEPYWHRSVPPNDGGIALGQVVAAIREHQRNQPKP